MIYQIVKIRICICLSETQIWKLLIDLGVPCKWCLFQLIKGLLQLVNMGLKPIHLKASWLVYSYNSLINLLRNVVFT